MPNKLNTSVLIVCFFAALPLCNAQADGREYQHGIDFVPLGDGTYWLFWSSSKGNPPKGEQTLLLPNGTKCFYFNHDVYYSYLDVRNVAVEQNRLVALPEAQEPVSAAISDEGNILITMEDGSDSSLAKNCEGRIQQRYQIFTSSLQSLTDTKTVNTNGAHSGHVTAAGDRFVIVYSQDWIAGGGVDNRRTGSNIELDVVDGRGARLHHKKITNEGDSFSDWWPLVAASEKYAMLVWQQYVESSRYAKLMMAVYDPLSDKLVKKATVLQSDVYYYHYDVQYLPGVNRFIVAGNHLGEVQEPAGERRIPAKTQKGFLFLLDEMGTIIHRWQAGHKCEICNSYHTHPFVREAQAAIYSEDSHAKLLYPVKPKGALLFSVSVSEVSLQKYIDDDYYWQSLGTDGIFMDARKVLFATLSRQGLRMRTLILE